MYFMCLWCPDTFWSLDYILSNISYEQHIITSKERKLSMILCFHIIFKIFSEFSLLSVSQQRKINVNILEGNYSCVCILCLFSCEIKCVFVEGDRAWTQWKQSISLSRTGLGSHYYSQSMKLTLRTKKTDKTTIKELAPSQNSWKTKYLWRKTLPQRLKLSPSQSFYFPALISSKISRNIKI